MIKTEFISKVFIAISKMNFFDEAETASDDSVYEAVELIFVFVLLNIVLLVIFDFLTDRAEK